MAGVDTSELTISRTVGIQFSADEHGGQCPFFVHLAPAMVLSAGGGTAATAAVFGAMQTAFGAHGAPCCLTLPSCVTMSACYLLQDNVPGLTLASSPLSPEKNTI